MVSLMEKQIRRKAIFYGTAAILLASTFAAVIYNLGVLQTTLISTGPPIPAAHTSFLATFPSAEALTSFLKNNSQTQGPFSLYGPADVKLFNSPSSPLLPMRGTAVDTFSYALGTEGGSYQHSTTNIQVTGVDEADTVKTDDDGYMYVVSDDTVYILTAYPATQASVLAKIKYTDMHPIGIFVSGQRLAVLGSQYSFPTLSVFPLYNGFYVADIKTFIRLYDISDKSNPVLVKDFALTGSYFNSRMIGDYIYLVASKPAYTINDTLFLPEIIMNGRNNEIAPTEIHYFNGTEEYYQYTTFVAMNVQNATEAPVYLTTLLGGASSMYVSQQNMYVTFQDYYWGGNTTIYRIRLQANNMTIEASGKIPGYEHNQYSMDEYGNYFRIQTQTWSTAMVPKGLTATNVYVLDMNLTIVGTLENIAPGENFHSARFMGDRCYLVTFQKTDPLFVIDLSNPTNPQVLGNLTIPGYSDYLHPYDETHLIGVGKNTVDAQNGYFAWYQGIKISLFDVTNVTNPIQSASYVIGDRGSDTPVLSDPKAFLFDRSKNLLVIPVLNATIDKSKYPSPVPDSAYGDPVWQGAYVFDISLYHDLVVEGCITHVPNGTSITDQGYWIKRSLYIEDVLYTISDRMVKMNSLEDMSEIGQIALS
jgi:inhibitor of cysteine peptidase